jgi:flagellar FliL protein
MPRNEDIDSDESPSAPPAPKKKKLRWIILSVVATALLTSTGLYFMGIVTLHGKETEKAEEPPAPPAPPIYLNLDPPFVVNFEDHGDLRFLQVAVVIMTHDAKAVDAMNFHMPRVRNSLILLLGNQHYEAISNMEGKEKLRTAMLGEVRKVMQDATGSPGAEAVYFTSFVMQ